MGLMLNSLPWAWHLGAGLATMALVFLIGVPLFRIAMRRLVLVLFGSDVAGGTAAASRLARVWVLMLAVLALEIGAATGGLKLPQVVNHWLGRLLVPAVLIFGLEFFRIVVLDYLLASRRRVPKILHDIGVGVVYATVALIALSSAFNINLAPILTFSGLFSIVLGLALQDTLGNLMAGLAIHGEPPFSIGDWVSIDGTPAQIKEITWRAVKALTMRQELIAIPNATVGKAQIINYSQPTGIFAEEILIGVAYDVPPAEAISALESCVAQTPCILAEPAATVRLARFDDSAMSYRIRFFIDGFRNREPVVDELMARVWYKFQQRGLAIAFPTRTVIQQDESVRLAQERELKLETFGGVDLLMALDDSERRSLAAAARIARYRQDELVFAQGDPGDSLYIIARGRIELLIGIGDEALPIATLEQGAFFGEMALLTGELRSASARTLEPCDLVVLAKADLDPLFRRRPEVPLAISRIIADRKARTSSARQRLEHELESRIARAGHDEDTEADTMELFNRIKTFFRLV